MSRWSKPPMTKRLHQVTLTFTFAEINQLMAYLNDRDVGSDSGWYYGDKEQFEIRHAALKKKLENVAL